MFEIKRGVNKFYIGSEKKPLAEVIVTDMKEKVITIEHTYVYEELKGKGVGKLLIKAVVDFAIEEDKKLIPLCSFANKEFEKNKDYDRVKILHF